MAVMKLVAAIIFLGINTVINAVPMVLASVKITKLSSENLGYARLV